MKPVRGTIYFKCNLDKYQKEILNPYWLRNKENKFDKNSAYCTFWQFIRTHKLQFSMIWSLQELVFNKLSLCTLIYCEKNRLTYRWIELEGERRETHTEYGNLEYLYILFYVFNVWQLLLNCNNLLPKFTIFLF